MNQASTPGPIHLPVGLMAWQAMLRSPPWWGGGLHSEKTNGAGSWLFSYQDYRNQEVSPRHQWQMCPRTLNEVIGGIIVFIQKISLVIVCEKGWRGKCLEMGDSWGSYDRSSWILAPGGDPGCGNREERGVPRDQLREVPPGPRS